MRRFALPIVFSLTLVAACNAAGPLDPPATAPSRIHTSVQNDSTPSAGNSVAPTEAANGGILIGSGT
jgi:hypothetical protein